LESSGELLQEKDKALQEAGLFNLLNKGLNPRGSRSSSDSPTTLTMK